MRESLSGLLFPYNTNIKDGESVNLSPEDVERMLALIDLLFLAQDEGKVIPS